MPLTQSTGPRTYLIPFTDDELEAIYKAIEEAPEQDWSVEEALSRVIGKITPAKVGDSRPEGAVDHA